MGRRDVTRRGLLQCGAALAGAGLLAGCGMLGLGRPRMVKLGFLGPTWPDSYDDAVPQTLAERGYVEGQNLVIEYRRAEGKIERLPELAAELVRLPVDVILAPGNTAARVAKEATSTIPIVMAVSIDPVGSGLVASLARPGGNVTGLTVLAPELTSRRIELIEETLPGATRVAVMVNNSIPASLPQLREAERAAQAVGLTLQVLDVREADDIARAFEAAARGRAEALLVLDDALFSIRRAEIVELATSAQLPAIYANTVMARDGGLLAYGPDFWDQFRRAALYVEKILWGAKPADLAVELPTKFNLVVNLKAAEALGLTLPDAVLAQANEIVR